MPFPFLNSFRIVSCYNLIGKKAELGPADAIQGSLDESGSPSLGLN